MILTDDKGQPLSPPEPPASGATVEDKITFLRAYAAYNDKIADLANRAFERGLRSKRRAKPAKVSTA